MTSKPHITHTTLLDTDAEKFAHLRYLHADDECAVEIGAEVEVDAAVYRDQWGDEKIEVDVRVRGPVYALTPYGLFELRDPTKAAAEALEDHVYDTDDHEYTARHADER
jgi:hypothetical protein